MVQLPSLAWLSCESQTKPNGCSFLFERVEVTSGMENISPVIFRLELELLSLKVEAKPEEPPPSHHDSEVHGSVAIGVSAGPDSPALGGHSSVRVGLLSCCGARLMANRQSSSAVMHTQRFGLFRRSFLVSTLLLKLLNF